MYPKCILKKDTYPWLRYISNDAGFNDAKVTDTTCILMYLDVS